MESSVVAFFGSLVHSICRVVVSNTSSEQMELLVKEIHQLVNQLYGVVILEDAKSKNLSTKYLAFSAEIPLALIHEIVAGQSLVDPEESLLLLSPEVLNEMDPVQYHVLSIVQEESQLKDTLAAANIEFGGAITGGVSLRKARKHRAAVVHTEDEQDKEIRVKRVPFEVFQQPSAFDLLDDLCKEQLLGEQPMLIDGFVPSTPPTPSTEPCISVKQLEEYDTLVAWMKILGQPEDLVLKKITAFEDYDERMKKLGAKLKHSLSPEDLIKTLASIQPSTSGSESEKKSSS